MALRKIYGLLFLAIISFTSKAQSVDTAFKNEWIGIDTLIIKNDLTKTALEKVNLLYQIAKQRQLPDQVIKCLIYQYSLQDRITSNDPNLIIRTIQKEINISSDDVQKAILYSLLAKSYWQYYTNNRWALYNRKNTAGLQKEDIATWSADDFVASISKYFLRSLENRTLLQKTNIAGYDAVIIKGNARNLRPTLFDLLAHEALDYFTSGETYLTKPVYSFTISDEHALGTENVFSNSNFLTRDSTAQQWISLRLFQQLMEVHQNDQDKNAFLIINLERIEWVYQQAVFTKKEAAYIKALEEVTTQYSSFSAASKAWYLLAREEADKAGHFQPFGDTVNRYGYTKARQMAEKALTLYKDTNEGTVNLRNLLREIARKELRTQTEKVNIPGKPFRALVSYRNIDTLYGRIIRADDHEDIRIGQNEKDYWKTVTQIKAYKTFRQSLPLTNDHQLHSVEVKLESLPVGEYALISSNNPAFKEEESKMCIQFFYVSNISYIKNNRDFFVLSRDNGKPMPGVKVTISKLSYNRDKKKNFDDNFTEKITDENGFFRVDGPAVDNNIRCLFTKGNDRLSLRESDFLYYENTEEEFDASAAKYEKNNNRVFFFTDRSIYRPGQTLFFKGIAVTKDYKTKLSKLIVSKDSGWVYLKDANRKKIDSIKIALNSYGSFSGKFQLPQNALSGNFSISVADYNQTSTSFSVEEYKRPTFHVIFDKVKGSYRLNDSVTISGTVIAYAGNKIDGAKVAYNITRNTRFLDHWLWRKPSVSGGNSEISHGEMKTDADGKFTIRFIAMADDMIDKNGNPLFDFSIAADVTDINGETRSNHAQVTVGYTSLIVKLNAPLLTQIDSLKEIQVISTNLSDEKEPALVHMKIYSLQTPDHPLRSRYWSRPDQYAMSKKEFTGFFPTDEYENETDYLKWATGELVTEGTVNTKEKDALIIAPGLLKTGAYRIEAITKDKYGEEVKSIHYIQVFSVATGVPVMPAFQFNYTINNQAKPGQTASFISGSMADKLYVINKTDRPKDKTNNYSLTERKKGFEIINFTPEEKDRGGVSISETYVYDNRIYSYKYYIEVPWNNKELQVQYASYRDKTEPGSKEKWTVTVQTDKNEKAAAELLTGMYDASLDQFKSQIWSTPNLWDKLISLGSFIGNSNFSNVYSQDNYLLETQAMHFAVSYDQIASSAYELLNRNLTKWINDSTLHIPVVLKRSLESLKERVVVGYRMKYEMADARIQIRGLAAEDQNKMKSGGASEGKLEPPPMALAKFTAPPIQSNIDTPMVEPDPSSPVSNIYRKNFNETAFFFPQLYADSSGKYSFSFTMPEALTQWKWMSVAHTKDLAYGSYSTNIVTQKKLMIQPNAPRFLREGDVMEFSAKIVNLSDKEMTGQVSFELVDAATNTSVDGWFQNVFPSQYFTVEAGKSFPLKFPIQVPFSFNQPLTWRIIAKAGEYSDGEENTLPVLTNRVLVTESLPLYLQNDTTQSFKFDKLINTESESLSHEGITVEYTSNPVWYAVQALPYLMEYPYECAEQTFNRFYANSLASFIVNKNPKIKQVFEQWKADSTSLKSNLQKNEELKQVLLQETPWVMQAEGEEQQKKNIALLFDMVRLSSQTESLIEKLSQLQLPDGSFSWFKGGSPDRYMTNYILTGIGKLKRLGALSPEIAMRIRNILVNAIKYSDSKIGEDYNRLIKNKADLTKQQIANSQIDYLYMRSFFRDIAQQSPQAYDFYYNQGKQFWIKQNSYYRAQLGLIYFRNKDEKFAAATILPALLENSINDPKLGIYWKSTYAGYWYQSPIEHQSMMIAFMSEINNNESLTKNINAMKTWLLLNKQTSNWKTTVATADACYALLLNGIDWLNTERKISIQLGKYTINNNTEKTTTGSGYFKKRIEGKQVTQEMGNITVSAKSSISRSPSWGSVYWQYFEDMDKVTSAVSPLSINKKLFIEKNTDKGKVLELIKEGDELKTGDKVVIRMELRSDRDMDYLHLKDMRASSMEPVNVLSSYKWQDGLGYYESTKDASSNFFISHLPKGTYVFEYPVFITHTGLFSVGLATIQCMYAPEFAAHSESVKIRVAE